MELNTLKPAPGAKRARRRVGRGIGSGLGKTGGRGHKGQRARSGGFHKVGFEGGQMPLQRRLPKRGFNSPLRGDVAEVRLGDLERVASERIDLAALQEAGVVPSLATRAKVILSGKLTRKIALVGISVSKGARAAIEAAGGSTDAPLPQPKAKPEPKIGKSEKADAEKSAAEEASAKTEARAAGGRPKGGSEAKSGGEGKAKSEGKKKDG